MRAALYWISALSLIALIALCLAWELWLAPLRNGGSALAFKALPLLLPLFGILRGRRYTYQWAWILGLAYFTEGVVRAWSEQGTSRQLAVTEIVLSLAFFATTVLFARVSGRAAAAPTR
jgi:uncharacterized membrane protein